MISYKGSYLPENKETIKDVISIRLYNSCTNLDFTFLTRIKFITLQDYDGQILDYPDTLESFKVYSGTIKHFHIKKNLKKLEIFCCNNLTADTDATLEILETKSVTKIPDLFMLQKLICATTEYVIPMSLTELTINVKYLYASKYSRLRSLEISGCVLFPEVLPNLEYLKIETIKSTLPYMPNLKNMNCHNYNLRFVPKNVWLFSKQAKLIKSSKQTRVREDLCATKDGSYSLCSSFWTKNKYFKIIIWDKKPYFGRIIDNADMDDDEI
jgi:hypothetical protein